MTLPETVPTAPATAHAPPQRRILCDMCWALPGRPCTLRGHPAGDHLARWVKAVKLGLISKGELAAAIGGIEVLADHVLIMEATR